MLAKIMPFLSPRGGYNCIDFSFLGKISRSVFASHSTQTKKRRVETRRFLYNLYTKDAYTKSKSRKAGLIWGEGA